MASDRLSKEAAELVAIPPFEEQWTDTDFLLAQPKVKENIQNVPVNQPLMESILENDMLNPLLVMNNYWPIAGSQRLRAVYEINKTKRISWEVKIHRFEEDWWNMYYLWPEKEFVNKAVAVWFQMVELAWKSKYYTRETDGKTKMTEFEELGDKLQGWKHKQL
jgi:disulfide oxidoreductase YuzD